VDANIASLAKKPVCVLKYNLSTCGQF